MVSNDVGTSMPDGVNVRIDRLADVESLPYQDQPVSNLNSPFHTNLPSVDNPSSVDPELRNAQVDMMPPLHRNGGSCTTSTQYSNSPSNVPQSGSGQGHFQVTFAEPYSRTQPAGLAVQDMAVSTTDHAVSCLLDVFRLHYADFITRAHMTNFTVFGFQYFSSATSN